MVAERARLHFLSHRRKSAPYKTQAIKPNTPSLMARLIRKNSNV